MKEEYSVKEFNEETFAKFNETLSEFISDADYYEAFSKEILSKGRYIEGCMEDYSEPAKVLGKDPKFITNKLVLYTDWCKNYEKFCDDFQLLVKIFHKDKEALKERDEFIKLHKNVVSAAAYTDNQIQGMINTFVPERDTIDQTMITGNNPTPDTGERIKFGSSIINDEPDAASFAQQILPGLMKLPDGTMMITNQLQLQAYLASVVPMQQNVALTPEMQNAIRTNGLPYVPYFMTMEGQPASATLPTLDPVEVPWSIEQDAQVKNKNTQNTKGNRPWCKYMMDSGSLNNLQLEMKNHPEMFKNVKKTAFRLLNAKKFVEVVYEYTHMDAGLFVFSKVMNENNFIITMHTHDGKHLHAHYHNEDVTFDFH